MARSLTTAVLPFAFCIACGGSHAAVPAGSAGNDGSGGADAGGAGAGGASGAGGTTGTGGATPHPHSDSTLTFSPPPNAYPAEQSVTITTSLSGASIRYTTDGSEPTPTTGTLYEGPVKMQAAIGTLSNASGATLLKAQAYKDGVAHPIYSGIYEIITPAPKPSPSLLRGIAHVAYHVTNLAKTRHFWVDYLGF